MREEIFGPILPIVPYESLDEALAIVADHPHPLALYVFSRRRVFCERVLSTVRAGGACVNHVVVHLVNPSLPFGGVGPSGIGRYHGEHGFLAFSHEKPVVVSPTWFEMGLTFPPFGTKLRWLRLLLTRRFV
jgi:acyl-CoA reductase-like NAD-dependent aldehyde dehydrogenase